MWERLASAGHPYTRPDGSLPKTRAALRKRLDLNSRLKGLRLDGARVLALAAGGGWDGIIFAKLGAETTVADLSPSQIATVEGLAASEKVTLRTEVANMKDLSRFDDASFDLVWHCHSLVFIDDVDPVFREVGRVLAPGGTYLTGTMHPTTLRMYRTFTGQGWVPLSTYYDDGPVPYLNDEAATWEWDGGQVLARTLEYGHRFDTLVNGIVAAGMLIDGLWEYSETPPDPNTEPGSDEHLESLFPSYVQIRARKV